MESPLRHHPIYEKLLVIPSRSTKHGVLEIFSFYRCFSHQKLHHWGMKSSPCLTKQPAVKVHLTRLSYGWSGSCAAIAHPEAIQTRRSFNREAVDSMAMLDCRRAYLYNSVEFISLNFYIYIMIHTYIHTYRQTDIHTYIPMIT